MIYGLFTIIGGILAASALIIARKPNAKQLIDKLTPYQGWVGITLFFWGAWGLITFLRLLSVVSLNPLPWIFYLVASATNLGVGFLLGFGLISKYTLGSSPVAQVRGQNLRLKLAAFQGPLGLIGIAVGAICLVLFL
jgi:hypothetical protein